MDLGTGRLSFRDAFGKLLLRDRGNAGRTFTPATVGGEPTSHVEQRFELPENQAFYGLGCLQDGIFDYTGHSAHLVQDNTVDVNPMLVSTAGYGILWDNASATDVSLGDLSQVIPPGRLYTRRKVPGGLSGFYFDDKELKHVLQGRIDPTIDFDWKQGPAEGIPHDNFSVQWDGLVKTGDAGEYTFTAKTDDGVRLFVNEKKIIDDWRVKPLSPSTGRITLPANTLVPIRMEYFQNQGEAIARLEWTPPGKGTDFTWRSDTADQIDYYVILGPELDDVISGYRQATGQAPMFGKWAFGYWQCKERYKSSQELVDVAQEFRKQQFPIDNIVQDWFYWDPYPWGSHRFDPKRYPDPAGLIRTLHDDFHLHFMISVWAKFAPGSDNYDELDKKGLLYADYHDWGGNNRYYDAFSPLGREIYWRQMRDKLFRLGVDAWWLDATEPEVPMNAFREQKTALGPAGRELNAYSLMTTEAVYKGQRKETNDKRVFILTRSVFAGQQRNAAATWSGDIQGTWDVLKRQVSGGLNFCMAGVPYWCTDIGGFFGGSPSDPAYRELFTRWFEWGSFCPIFRVHGTGEPKEPWRFGPDTQAILAKYDRLRYRLLPYTYSLAWRVTNDGFTMMRGLPMDFRTDKRTWSIGDQLMFGSSLMVSPVLEPGATSRSVYLPTSPGWFDFWTGERLRGGQDVVAPAPIGTLPIYVRAGSIVPFGPPLQYSSEKPADPIELRIYPGSNASFKLYDDQGDGYGYEQGQRSVIPMRWNEATHTLVLGDCQGTYPGMQATRTFHVVLVGQGHGAGIEEEPKSDRVVRYEGSRMQVRIL